MYKDGIPSIEKSRIGSNCEINIEQKIECEKRNVVNMKKRIKELNKKIDFLFNLYSKEDLDRRSLLTNIGELTLSVKYAKRNIKEAKKNIK